MNNHPNAKKDQAMKTMKDDVRPVEWKGDMVLMLDQRLLPREETYLELRTSDEVAKGITDMVIRGAPAIGVAAAMGIAVEAVRLAAEGVENPMKALHEACGRMALARPTAVNLGYAVDRLRSVMDRMGTGDFNAIRDALVEDALAIESEQIKADRAMGEHGAVLFEHGDTILTHCNAGGLATSGIGTALGVIRVAAERGKGIRVLADETRPYLQGARLTCWELMRAGVPVHMITDSMAAYLMKKGQVNRVIVGSDRIAANGDVANKIGTYGLAVLAKAHGLPFYVAAPLSTVDFECPTGDDIPIEQRDPGEVTRIYDHEIAPEGCEALHPAFDVTPNELVTAIITEHGIVTSPYQEGLAAQRK